MARPPICLLVDGFPVLTETFVGAEARELARLDHRVRIEAVARGDGERRADDPRTHWREDDGRRARRGALVWLMLRHPLGCARDLVERRRWRREEWVPRLAEIAPVARRIARERERHLH